MNLNLARRIEKLENQQVGDEFDNMSQDELRAYIEEQIAWFAKETMRQARIRVEGQGEPPSGISGLRVDQIDERQMAEELRSRGLDWDAAEVLEFCRRVDEYLRTHEGEFSE